MYKELNKQILHCHCQIKINIKKIIKNINNDLFYCCYQSYFFNLFSNIVCFTLQKSIKFDYTKNLNKNKLLFSFLFQIMIFFFKN